MTGEAWLRALACCNLGGVGARFFWFCGNLISILMQSQVSSSLYSPAPLRMLTVLRKQHYKFLTNSALHTPTIAHAAVQWN